MPARMRDIAQELGLTATTVWKVLRNRPDVGEQTRKKVLARLKEVNYRPNYAARALVTNRTWTTGLVIPSFLPFFADIATAISDMLQRAGYSLFIAVSGEELLDAPLFSFQSVEFAHRQSGGGNGLGDGEAASSSPLSKNHPASTYSDRTSIKPPATCSGSRKRECACE